MDPKKIELLLSYQLPLSVKERFQSKFPDYTEVYSIVELGLKEWYLTAYFAMNSRLKIAMPNYIIDELWHIHILDTMEYDDFCQKVFGAKLHHKLYSSDVCVDEKSDNYKNLIYCISEMQNNLTICAHRLSLSFGRILLSTPSDILYMKDRVNIKSSITDLSNFYIMLNSVK